MQEYIKILRSGNNTTLIILNDEMNDIVKKVKSFEDSGLLLKGIRKQIKMKLENKKENFLVCY